MVNHWLMPLLRINELTTEFLSPTGDFTALHGVSFSIERGETVCLVGESGCGKSVTALSVMRLLAHGEAAGAANSARSKLRVSGEALLEGTDLLKLTEREMRRVRGKRISMIYQEPMTSLNPVFPVGWQIAEAIRLHDSATAADAKSRALEMLRLVEIPDPMRCYDAYPHMLSGGMRQRAMIAMALCCQPDLLIADEPTTALDVTIQAQILNLIYKLKNDLGMAVLFITHDMGVVSRIADRVLVMYAGRIVEETDRLALFRHPAHPYTRGLLACIPRMGSWQAYLPVIEGALPDPLDFPEGCAFAPRCLEKMQACLDSIPSLSDHAYGKCACFASERPNGADLGVAANAPVMASGETAPGACV